MSSPAQITANHQNGRKSKGPTSPEGKAVSSANARTHGLLSRDVVGPNEDPAAFQVLHERLHGELNPVGQLEEDLVSRIAAQTWRLRRVERVEAGLYAHYNKLLADRAFEEWKKSPHSSEELREQLKVMLQKFVQSNEAAGEVAEEPAGSGETGLQVAKPDKAARAERHDQEAKPEAAAATLGAAFAEDSGNGNAFSKLVRYEAAIERSLHRNLHELQRLQATRRGLPIAPPAAIDIDISTDNCALDQAVNQ